MATRRPADDKCVYCDAEVLDELACPNSPDICVDCCPCHPA